MTMLDPCENRTCEHLAALHDIYEPADPYPTCCVEGCKCGQPGDVDVRRLDDGTVVVDRADPVIRVSHELLDSLADAASLQWDPDTMVLVLGSAGRYDYLRPDPNTTGVSIFGRVKS